MNGPPSMMTMTKYKFISWHRRKIRRQWLWMYTKKYDQIMKVVGKAIKAGGHVDWTEYRQKDGRIHVEATIYTPC